MSFGESYQTNRRHDVERLTGIEYGNIVRRSSLVHPERQRVDPNHPQYHYHHVARRTMGIHVHPSATGHEPLYASDSLSAYALGTVTETDAASQSTSRERGTAYNEFHDSTEEDDCSINLEDEDEYEKLHKTHPIMPKEKGISLWQWYCRILTLPIVPSLMKPFHMTTKERQMAWREKMGLISVILIVAALVGFLTFGFTQTVCSNKQVRIHFGEVPSNNIIISGNVYDFGSYYHPKVQGIDESVVLYPPVNAGGKDASFLFQNVNGHCKGLIVPRKNATIPHTDKTAGWYFPCQLINPADASLVPTRAVVKNDTRLYRGWGCHTGAKARETLYNTKNRTAVVYFSWDDLKNTDSQLVMYNGDILNLDYLRYLLKDEFHYPEVFDLLLEDKSLRGQDLSQRMSYGHDRRTMLCLKEIVKVGEIDTEAIGCIASSVVLYTSLVFIIGLVAVKFLLACYFRFVIARKQGAYAVSLSEFNRRENAIEDWTSNIYTQANLPTCNRRKRRTLFLDKIAPQERTTAGRRHQTMSMQIQDMRMSRVFPTRKQPTSKHNTFFPGAGIEFNYCDSLQADTSYFDNNYEAYSMDNLPAQSLTVKDANRKGFEVSELFLNQLNGDSEYLIPQPPITYQPFGFPLIHCMCLVTAYSESVEGLRTTLDSIATTEYPNSHKLIIIICDGLIKGAGNNMTTPEICLSMMTDFAQNPEKVEAYSYVSVVTGAKRHNMAKVFAGFYKYDDATVPIESQQRVPLLCIVKCGTPEEANDPKPGNRGKRDSQIILMSFLQRVMFDERMTALEFEIFTGIRRITGIAPDFYEAMMMVDADTKVYPDCLTHMVAELVRDPMIMGLCGETKIANKRESWVTAIQVFEYFISHHQAKAFESVFGGVTCLPGCFSIFRIKSPKGAEGYWVPILCNPDIVERYSDNVVDTLHKKNLLLLGEDRYLSSLMLRTFPKRKMIFVPKAACKTIVPSSFKVLLSQRRRWINSTIHNLMELVLVKDLCGVFIISMQFVVFVDLVSTLVLPAAISFTIYIVIIAIVSKPTPTMSLILLALILGLPGLLIVVTATRASYILWMLIYLLALPIWNFVLPMYAYWKFDDFSWGETQSIEGGDKGGHDESKGEFDSSRIVMMRWREFQRMRNLRETNIPDAPS